jgi:hypothetical protein
MGLFIIIFPQPIRCTTRQSYPVHLLDIAKNDTLDIAVPEIQRLTLRGNGHTNDDTCEVGYTEPV